MADRTTSHYLNQWGIYSLLGLNELILSDQFYKEYALL